MPSDSILTHFPALWPPLHSHGGQRTPERLVGFHPSPECSGWPLRPLSHHSAVATLAAPHPCRHSFLVLGALAVPETCSSFTLSLLLLQMSPLGEASRAYFSIVQAAHLTPAPPRCPLPQACSASCLGPITFPHGDSSATHGQSTSIKRAGIQHGTSVLGVNKYKGKELTYVPPQGIQLDVALAQQPSL